MDVNKGDPPSSLCAAHRTSLYEYLCYSSNRSTIVSTHARPSMLQLVTSRPFRQIAFKPHAPRCTFCVLHPHLPWPSLLPILDDTIRIILTSIPSRISLSHSFLIVNRCKPTATCTSLPYPLQFTIRPPSLALPPLHSAPPTHRSNPRAPL